MAVMTLSTTTDSFGDRLGALRRARGWTVVQVGYEAGVDPSTISLLERGRRNPSAQLLERLADVYEVSMDQLYRGTP